MIKEALSLFLFVSLVIFEYPPLSALQQLRNLHNQYGIQFDATSLLLQIIGIAILHLTVFGVIWIIPEDKSPMDQSSLDNPRPRRTLVEENQITFAAHDASLERSRSLIDSKTEKKLKLLDEPKYIPPYVLEEKKKRRASADKTHE